MFGPVLTLGKWAFAAGTFLLGRELKRMDSEELKKLRSRLDALEREMEETRKKLEGEKKSDSGKSPDPPSI